MADRIRTRVLSRRAFLACSAGVSAAFSIVPETAMKAYPRPPKTIPRVRGSHEGDWIRACKEGKDGARPCSNFDYAGPLTEIVLLGVAAILRKHEKLEWDAEKMCFKNNGAANALLRRDYRRGWTL